MIKTLRHFQYFCLKQSSFFRRIRPSSEEIDVMIPAVEKDLQILPLCLAGIRHCVEHPIKRIYIVAPDTAKFHAFCEKENLIFVPEKTVFGFGPESIDYRVNGQNRAGWIFQQLLKLSGKIGMSKYFLVIDADHILLRPTVFLSTSGRTVFYLSREHHLPYYENLQRLFGLKSIPNLSFVDHKMLFSRPMLKQIHERLGGESQWVQTILQSLDKTEISSFSEYEMFGLTCPKSKRLLMAWENKNKKYSDLTDYETLCRRFAKRYRSITFPDYISR